MEAFLRGAKAQALAGPLVQVASDACAVVLREPREVASLRGVLPDQTVGVFAGATLPRVVRRGEVERHPGGSFNRVVVVKLGAVVGGDRREAARMLAHEADGTVRGRLGRPGRQLPEQQKSGLPVDEAEEAVPTPGAEDRVDLPVPDFSPVVARGRPLADVPLAGESPAAVVGALPFPAQFPRPPQMGMEHSAPAAVLPDVAIDRFVTDVEFAAPTEVPGDLLRAPLAEEQRLHATQFLEREPSIAPRHRPAAHGERDRHAGSIVAMPAPIPAQLAANRAAMPPQLAADVPEAEALFPEGRDHVSFAGGDLAITHCDSPCLGGLEESLVSRVTSVKRQGVALSL